MKHTIDAQDKKLGRVASEAAKILSGKQTTHYVRNAVEPVTVNIINASKVKIDVKKLKEKEYITYTGYPGGLKNKTALQLMAKKGYSGLFVEAVYGMLPINKLRAKIIKNLIVTE
jgi:large subunit ribosomal protein L13